MIISLRQFPTSKPRAAGTLTTLNTESLSASRACGPTAKSTMVRNITLRSIKKVDS